MLKLISINIERDKHHETTIPFLKSEGADVICIQEVFQHELHKYEEALGMKSFFRPMCYYDTSLNNRKEIMGIAILTKSSGEFFYEYMIGEENAIPFFSPAKDPKIERNVINIILAWVNIKDSDGKIYRIANTHFTWTSDGESTLYQKEDIVKLVTILEEKLKQFVLVGDLNSPRGKDTFEMLASKYKDNIPPEYDSSIDPKLHRIPGLKYMVDGLFSTPEYVVRDVKLIEGVSDHKAVVAILE